MQTSLALAAQEDAVLSHREETALAGGGEMRRQPGLYTERRNGKAARTLTPTRPAAAFCKQVTRLRAHHREAQVQRAVGGLFFITFQSGELAC